MKRTLTVMVLVTLAMLPLACKRIAGFPQSGDPSDETSALQAPAVSGNGTDAVSFCDNCNTFNSSLWSKADWSLGKGWFRTANVSASGGYYKLKLSASSWNDAEIYTPTRYGCGFTSTSFKTPSDSGAISSIFFYQGVSGQNDEIDIEIWKTAGKWSINFTIDSAYDPVAHKGRVVYSHSYTPSFDPSASYHTYAIDWAVGGIAFFVDGSNKGTYRGGRPTHQMQIHMNCWWPTWLKSTKPSSDKYMSIDWISYSGY
jgi:beta-glucanase (GH16 family)